MKTYLNIFKRITELHIDLCKSQNENVSFSLLALVRTQNVIFCILSALMITFTFENFDYFEINELLNIEKVHQTLLYYIPNNRSQFI